MFPNEITNITKNLTCIKDDIGRSNDEVYLFENIYVLKISNNKDSLLNEKTKIDWLYNKKIQKIKSIAFIEENNKYFYLREYLDGDSLISSRILDNPKLLIEILVNVVNKLKSLDKMDCPFTNSEFMELTHGDLCLPNIYVNENNEFIGFIDVSDLGLNDRWLDYSMLIWSLEYNLKTNYYTPLLLKALNITLDKDKYKKYMDEEYTDRYIFRKANYSDIDSYYQMVLDRITWMDSNNIEQWNKNHYEEVFPKDFYLENVDNIYVLEFMNSITAAAIINTSDASWNDNKPCLYIHNLVTRINTHCGKYFINDIAKLAKKNNRSALRLDSQTTNQKLGEFYKSIGFVEKGFCGDEFYQGTLREKII